MQENKGNYCGNRTCHFMKLCSCMKMITSTCQYHEELSILDKLDRLKEAVTNASNSEQYDVGADDVKFDDDSQRWLCSDSTEDQDYLSFPEVLYEKETQPLGYEDILTEKMVRQQQILAMISEYFMLY